MKIKLKDYSLISITWIESQIKELELIKKHPMFHTDLQQCSLDAKISCLQKLQLELIPSEKLAEVSFNYGVSSMLRSDSPDINKHRQEFLNSEIEI